MKPDAGRMGLTHKQENELLEKIDPKSKNNPFKNRHARIRNELIIKIGLATGIRRGELLGMRIEDYNPSTGKIVIHRTPNDKLDPRLDKPQSKTRARELPLNKELSGLMLNYIAHCRRKGQSAAGKTPYLLLASKTGKPLSKKSLSKIFVTLRNSIESLPRGFSPHYLRYTANDRFSEVADRMIEQGKWTVTDEISMRCSIMGWVENSAMAIIYTRRHIKKKADEYSLSRQEQIMLKKDATE